MSEQEIMKAWGCSKREHYLEAVAAWLELPPAASTLASANENHEIEEEAA